MFSVSSIGRMCEHIPKICAVFHSHNTFQYVLQSKRLLCRIEMGVVSILLIVPTVITRQIYWYCWYSSILSSLHSKNIGNRHLRRIWDMHRMTCIKHAALNKEPNRVDKIAWQFVCYVCVYVFAFGRMLHIKAINTSCRKTAKIEDQILNGESILCLFRITTCCLHTITRFHSYDVVCFFHLSKREKLQNVTDSFFSAFSAMQMIA